MSLDITTANNTIKNFLYAWPLSSLRSMTIEEYADLSNHNAYCYWLEYGSRDLGEIGGIPLTKFGLWKYKNRKDYDEMYEADNTYAWDGKFGKTRTQAYKNIITTVIDIAEAANRSDWEYIESIKFHAVAKWKIAFLYSNKQLVPLYTREGLLKIAAGLGKYFPENTPIVQLQLFITANKPVEKDMIEYATDLWEHYVKGKPFRNYFIVGSKYNYQGEVRDIFPEMLASNTIAVGFLDKHDLTALVSASDEVINRFVAENYNEEDIALHKLQSYFRILLNLKPGDIIAIKSHGSYGALKIIAYAVVVTKQGKVYEYKPELLGHHINVDFVELGINRNLTLNYAGTIHHILPDKTDHLKAIFGPFLQVDDIALGSENEDENALDGEGTKYKSEESYQRGEIASRMVRQLHNIIQNSFYKELKKIYPRQSITLEFEGRVDIVRDSGSERWFYEIKPFENVISCLREATGQLIEYAFRFQDASKQTNLVIVGPGELVGEAIGFLDHYIDTVKLPINYQQHIVPLRQD